MVSGQKNLYIRILNLILKRKSQRGELTCPECQPSSGWTPTFPHPQHLAQGSPWLDRFMNLYIIGVTELAEVDTVVAGDDLI